MKMNLNIALTHLNLNNKYNISNIDKLTAEELKKNYHIQALNNHPDKSSKPDAKVTFQLINDAYVFLNNFINSDIAEIFHNNLDDDLYSTPYTDLIINFFKLLSTENNKPDDVNSFKKQCADFSNKVLEQLLEYINIDVIEDIYNLINTKIFNFSPETLQKIKDILSNKLKNCNIYIINPSIENLMDNEIFKLDISNEIVYVPLWHNYMTFNENIIKIEPILPDNITIDGDNVINYKFNTTFDTIIDMINKDNEFSYFKIDIHKLTLLLPVHELKFKKYQTYTFKKFGLPSINVNDILDNSKKSNTVIHIYIE